MCPGFPGRDVFLRFCRWFGFNDTIPLLTIFPLMPTSMLLAAVTRHSHHSTTRTKTIRMSCRSPSSGQKRKAEKMAASASNATNQRVATVSSAAASASASAATTDESLREQHQASIDAYERSLAERREYNRKCSAKSVRKGA